MRFTETNGGKRIFGQTKLSIGLQHTHTHAARYTYDIGDRSEANYQTSSTHTHPVHLCTPVASFALPVLNSHKPLYLMVSCLPVKHIFSSQFGNELSSIETKNKMSIHFHCMHFSLVQCAAFDFIFINSALFHTPCISFLFLALMQMLMIFATFVVHFFSIY